MGGKKKKKAGKKGKKEKKEGDEEEEKQEENPLFTVNLAEYGWIRVELKLCDAPSPKYNSFKVVMRSDDRILELKKSIIDYHGRVENVHIYNKDPYPIRLKDKRITQKPRVPPFRELPKLQMLMKEKEEKAKQAEAKAKKLAE